MGKGYPDYQTPAGRSAGGGRLWITVFSASIDGETEAYFDLAEIPAGYEWIFQHAIVSVDDDEAIHSFRMYSPDEAQDIWMSEFIKTGNYNFPGFTLHAGDIIRVYITNNHDSNKTFSGSITRIHRKI